MTIDDEFPAEITALWILQQEFPYNSLVNYIINLLDEVDESELPSGLYRLWLVRRFETDVENGGFGQFLGNAHSSHDGSDRFLRATLPAVRSFGLVELEPLVAETIRIDDDIVEFKRRRQATKDRDATRSICECAQSDEEADAFRKSTEARFDDLWDQWTTIDYVAWVTRLEQYIREHPDEFVFNKLSRAPQ